MFAREIQFDSYGCTHHPDEFARQLSISDNGLRLEPNTPTDERHQSVLVPGSH